MKITKQIKHKREVIKKMLRKLNQYSQNSLATKRQKHWYA